MMQLRPQEVFTIARGLEDHSDSTTYYVRAVIRNARTDEAIDTVNLVDRGDGHRFSYNWTVPADPSGSGFYILISTSVFTDSSYTVKSPNYGDNYDTFLVQERLNSNLIGSGADVDYKKIQKIVLESLGAIPKPEKIELPNLDLSPVIEQLNALKELVKSIEIPEHEKVDLTEVIKKVTEVKQCVTEIEMPEVDLSKILAAVVDQKEKWDDAYHKIADVMERLRPFFSNDVEEIKEMIKKMTDKLDGIAYVTLPPAKQIEESKQEIDL